ncbi:MAG: protease modulator HflC [Thermodesulfobacteriota bacterium]|nr:protease modulator HflC [Thermodesulfobacteriota bacterium]
MDKIVRFFLIGLVLVAAVTVWDGFYMLSEEQQVVITQFGKPVGEPVTTAGLHFKTPFIQDVTTFDKRILIWDGDPNQIPTNDKTFIYLDTTARWRISEPLIFLQAVNNVPRAMTILDDIIDSTVRDLVNKNDLVEIIRSSDWIQGERVSTVAGKRKEEAIEFGRDKIAEMIFESASTLTPKYGIELIDVMFKRVNYIESVRLKVYERMISERNRIAAEKRATGEGQKAEILGKVDRELKVITSEATRKAQEVKGKADAQAASIYAEAYNRDPDFYAFSKTLETYGKTVGKNTRLILSSDSEFYKYLNEK